MIPINEVIKLVQSVYSILKDENLFDETYLRKFT